MITTMLAAGGKRARAAAGAAAAALAMAAVLGPVPAAAHTAPGVHAAPAAQAAPAAAATPPGREWAAFTYYPPQHQLVLFAGSERALQVFPSTIWSWNGSTWSRGT